MTTIRYGDSDVPLIQVTWVRAEPEPYPLLGSLRPGERWRSAPKSEGQVEHMPIIDGEPVLAGLALARMLIDEGADWACASEAWSGVFLTPEGYRMGVSGALADVLGDLRNDDGSLRGLPDALGVRGDTVVMRESKRRGSDSLKAQQHAMVRRASERLGRRLDVAVVEWDG